MLSDLGTETVSTHDYQDIVTETSDCESRAGSSCGREYLAQGISPSDTVANWRNTYTQWGFSVSGTPET